MSKSEHRSGIEVGSKENGESEAGRQIECVYECLCVDAQSERECVVNNCGGR